jgi:hypothetical protein
MNFGSSTLRGLTVESRPVRVTVHGCNGERARPGPWVKSNPSHPMIAGESHSIMMMSNPASEQRELEQREQRE